MNDGLIKVSTMKERQPMRIVVTSPTGEIGQRVVRELLAPEFSVRVLTLEPERLSPEVQDQVEVIRGSTHDRTALSHALAGADALFLCIPAEPPLVADLPGHYQRHARAALQALLSTGTPRVVAVSALGKGLAADAGPMTGLHVMEDILQESGAAIRFLRCGVLMENLLSQAESIWRHGVLAYPMSGEMPIPMVAARDVADVALQWLVREDWSGIDAVAMRSPQDLSYVEVAAILGQALQRPVRYREASVNQYIRSLIDGGASLHYAQGQIQMFSALARGINCAEPTTPDSRLLTPLSEWANTELVPRVQSLVDGVVSELAVSPE